MKLSNIALSLVVVLGAVATGGSWYTGKQAEEKYSQLISQANQELKKLEVYGAKAQIKEVNFTRGFFSSEIKYVLDMTNGTESYQFSGDDKLFHGPFPLNRVKQGNLLPSMFSVESQISVPESLKAHLGGQAVALTAQTEMSYANDVHTAIKTHPLTWAEQGLEISAIQTTSTLDSKGRGKIFVQIPSFKATDKEENIQLQFDGIKYEAELTERNSEYPLLSFGKYVWESEKISLSEPSPSEDNATLFIEKLKSTGYGKLNQARYESHGDVVADISLQTTEGKAKIVTVKADILMDVLAKPLDQLTGYIGSPEKFEALDSSTQEQLVKDLLQTSPKLHLKTLSFENEKGKSDLAVIVNLKPFEFENVDNFIDIFENSSVDFTINSSFFEEVNKQLNLLNPKTKANAAEQAKSETAMLIEQAQQSGAVVVDKDNIKFKLEIHDGKVKHNGREMSEEEVQSVLFMLMLGLGSLGY